MLRFPVTTCPTGSYLKGDSWQLQLRFCVLSQNLSLDGLLKVDSFACHGFCVGVANGGLYTIGGLD